MNKHLRNALLIGAAAVGAMACTNKVISLLAERNNDLPVENGLYFNWRYGRLYYTKTGSGSPVLLIHDLNSSSSSYEWSKVIRTLSRNHTVYAPDLLGCGRSDKPNLTYTNFLYVQLINDFIKKVIGTRTSVAATGESFAFIVMACNMEPENFDRLIGVSPCDLYGLTRTPDKRKNVLKYVLDSPVIGTFLYNMDTTRFRIADTAARRYFYKEYMLSDAVVAAYYKGAKTENGRGKYLLASIRSNYTNINIVPAIQRIDNSISLIGGRMNPQITDIIENYKKFNPSIEDAYIAGTNYLPQLEAPSKFAELLNILLG